MTKKTIIQAFMNENQLKYKDADKIFDLIIDSMISVLKKEKALKITGFGCFKVKKRKDRIGRNPKTMEAYPIKSMNTVVFSPSRIFRESINKGTPVK